MPDGINLFFKSDFGDLSRLSKFKIGIKTDLYNVLNTNDRIQHIQHEFKNPPSSSGFGKMSDDYSHSYTQGELDFQKKCMNRTFEEKLKHAHNEGTFLHILFNNKTLQNYVFRYLFEKYTITNKEELYDIIGTFKRFYNYLLNKETIGVINKTECNIIGVELALIYCYQQNDQLLGEKIMQEYYPTEKYEELYNKLINDGFKNKNIDRIKNIEKIFQKYGVNNSFLRNSFMDYFTGLDKSDYLMDLKFIIAMNDHLENAIDITSVFLRTFNYANKKNYIHHIINLQEKYGNLYNFKEIYNKDKKKLLDSYLYLFEHGSKHDTSKFISYFGDIISGTKGFVFFLQNKSKAIKGSYEKYIDIFLDNEPTFANEILTSNSYKKIMIKYLINLPYKRLDNKHIKRLFELLKKYSGEERINQYILEIYSNQLYNFGGKFNDDKFLKYIINNYKSQIDFDKENNKLFQQILTNPNFNNLLEINDFCKFEKKYLYEILEHEKDLNEYLLQQAKNGKVDIINNYKELIGEHMNFIKIYEIIIQHLISNQNFNALNQLITNSNSSSIAQTIIIKHKSIIRDLLVKDFYTKDGYKLYKKDLINTIGQSYYKEGLQKSLETDLITINDLDHIYSIFLSIYKEYNITKAFNYHKDKLKSYYVEKFFEGNEKVTRTIELIAQKHNTLLEFKSYLFNQINNNLSECIKIDQLNGLNELLNLCGKTNLLKHISKQDFWVDTDNNIKCLTLIYKNDFNNLYEFFQHTQLNKDFLFDLLQFETELKTFLNESAKNGDGDMIYTYKKSLNNQLDLKEIEINLAKGFLEKEDYNNLENFYFSKLARIEIKNYLKINKEKIRSFILGEITEGYTKIFLYKKLLNIIGQEYFDEGYTAALPCAILEVKDSTDRIKLLKNAKHDISEIITNNIKIILKDYLVNISNFNINNIQAIKEITTKYNFYSQINNHFQQDLKNNLNKYMKQEEYVWYQKLIEFVGPNIAFKFISKENFWANAHDNLLFISKLQEQSEEVINCVSNNILKPLLGLINDYNEFNELLSYFDMDIYITNYGKDTEIKTINELIRLANLCKNNIKVPEKSSQEFKDIIGRLISARGVDINFIKNTIERYTDIKEQLENIEPEQLLHQNKEKTLNQLGLDINSSNVSDWIIAVAEGLINVDEKQIIKPFTKRFNIDKINHILKTGIGINKLNTLGTTFSKAFNNGPFKNTIGILLNIESNIKESIKTQTEERIQSNPEKKAFYIAQSKKLLQQNKLFQLGAGNKLLLSYPKRIINNLNNINPDIIDNNIEEIFNDYETKTLLLKALYIFGKNQSKMTNMFDMEELNELHNLSFSIFGNNLGYENNQEIENIINNFDYQNNIEKINQYKKLLIAFISFIGINSTQKQKDSKKLYSGSLEILKKHNIDPNKFNCTSLNEVLNEYIQGKNTLSQEIEFEILKLLGSCGYGNYTRELKIQIVRKSDPNGWVCGDETNCCMQLNTTKNNEYMRREDLSYFLIYLVGEDGREDLIAQSVLVAACDKNNGNVFDTLVIDNIEIAKRAIIYREVIAQGYEYLKQHFSNYEILIGKQYNDDGGVITGNCTITSTKDINPIMGNMNYSDCFGRQDAYLFNTNKGLDYKYQYYGIQIDNIENNRITKIFSNEQIKEITKILDLIGTGIDDGDGGNYYSENYSSAIYENEKYQGTIIAANYLEELFEDDEELCVGNGEDEGDEDGNEDEFTDSEYLDEFTIDFLHFADDVTISKQSEILKEYFEKYKLFESKSFNYLTIEENDETKKTSLINILSNLFEGKEIKEKGNEISVKLKE